MKKIIILLLVLMLIATPTYSLEGIFDIDKKDSILLAVGTLALFVGVKNTFVLSAEPDNHPGRVIMTALSYQTFVTLFSIVIKNN